MKNEELIDVPIDLQTLKTGRECTALENTIFEILSRLVQPEDTWQPDDASREINAIFPVSPVDEKQNIENDHASRNAEEFLWCFWTSSITVIGQVPYRHAAQTRVVNFIESLTKLPNKYIQLSMGECTVWADLPILGPCMRDNLDYGGENNTEKISRHINLSSFQARLLKTGLTGWINFAIWSLRDAFEEPQHYQETLEYYLISAGEWIFHAGEVLVAKISDEEPDEQWSRVTRGGTLYNGKVGLCLERWVFWRSRALEISEQVSESTRDVALDIAKTMYELEHKVPGLRR